MKIEKLADLLTGVNKSFGMDDIDIKIIGHIELQRKLGNKVTIMEFVDNFKESSPASTHRRIRKLCSKKLLDKTYQENNSRTKYLITGKKFSDLHSHLMGV